MPEDSQLEYTLPDDAWQDTFDKLCASRQVLREQNVLVKNFQAIIDSSVDASFASPIAKPAEPPRRPPKLSDGVFKTPVAIKRAKPKIKEKKKVKKKTAPAILEETSRRLTVHPFKCSISPVSAAALQTPIPMALRRIPSLPFHGTPIDPNLTLVDFRADLEGSTPLTDRRAAPFSQIAQTNQKDNTKLNSMVLDDYIRNRASQRQKLFERRRRNDKKGRNTDPWLEVSRPQEQREERKTVAAVSDEAGTMDVEARRRLKLPRTFKLLDDNRAAKADERRSKKRSTKKVCLPTEPPELSAQPNGPKASTGELATNDKRKTKSKGKKSSVAVTFGVTVAHEAEAPEVTTQRPSGNKRKRSKASGGDSTLRGQAKKVSSVGGQRKTSHNVPRITIAAPESPSKDSVVELDDTQLSNTLVAATTTTTSKSHLEVPPNMTPQNCSSLNESRRLVLQPGKWRKTLNVWRRTQHLPLVGGQPKTASFYENSVEFVGITKFLGQRKSIHFKQELDVDDHQSRVLQYCNQRKVIAFAELYSAKKMHHCRKIGEGVYGEVFLNTVERRGVAVQTVLKIIPIEGAVEVNGEQQKTYEQILPEIVISTELCNLRRHLGTGNYTTGFVDVRRFTCVKGVYPVHLVKLWEAYDMAKESENDHPRIFDESQVFVVLELAFSGRDMESFVFQSAEQAYYSLLQIILTLAVGEEALEFEHRDLHWGNVLLLASEKSDLTYRLQGVDYVVPSKGAEITIIDYTLSRMAVGGDCCHYNDLSTDEDLFSATGDYQFDIYRMMRDALQNNWESYEPRTNVFWISYIIEKMLNGVKYKSTRSKVHSTYMRKLKDLRESVLDFRSSVECARTLMQQI